MKVEKRSFKTTELRATGGKKPKIFGFIPYNSESEDIGYTEVLKPGVFTDSLRDGSKIMALYSHDDSKPLGNTGARTLQLEDSEIGLNVTIYPDLEISWAKDAYRAVKRGDVSGISFGFKARKDEWNGDVREILDAELLEISPVIWPAYSKTQASARSQKNKRGKKMDHLTYLRQRYGKLETELRQIRGLDFKDLTEEHRKREKQIGDELEELREAIDAADPDTQKRNRNHAPNNTATENRDGPFKSLGEQMLAIRQAGTPGQRPDPRLFEVRAATGLNSNLGSEGGFLIQGTFVNEIMKNAFDSAPLLNLLRRYKIGSNRLTMPGEDETSRADGSRHGGLLSYWLEEADEKIASKPKFRTISLNLHKVVVLTYATDELLDDASALDSYLRKVGPDEIGFKVQDAVVNGTGAGQPLGFMNSPALVEQAKETGQAADTILFENVLNLWSRMPARNRRTAIWLINQDVEPQLYSMSLDVGAGGIPVYMPASAGATKAPYSTLFGRPVMPLEQMPSLGDKGCISLIDPESYILADHGGVQFDMSIHVRFIYDESVFRFVYRVDGQPMFASAITPYKGANTLSPFVALAATSS